MIHNDTFNCCMASDRTSFPIDFRIGITNFFWTPLHDVIRIGFVCPELTPFEDQAEPLVLMADIPIPTRVAPEASEPSTTLLSVDPIAGPPTSQATPDAKGRKRTQQNKGEPMTNDTKEGAGKPPKQSQGGDVAKESGLSGKALKEAKKAGKQARRAQEKQTPPSQTQQAQVKKAEGAKGGIQKESPTPKGGHKRVGSTVTETQRTLPIRTSNQQSPTVVEPHAEHKHVSLFRHLDGHTRRTSISGAASSIHPAVLTLGLQMSSYEICGSTARCVATLLAFKRVSVP
jgi:hypothetical protein